MATVRASRRLHLSVAAATAVAGLAVYGAPASAEGETCNGLAATIVGAGTIAGTPGDDVIVGSSGNDVIRGEAGNDTICAGAGADIVFDGDGRDRVYLEDGEDAFVAYAFKDPLDVFDGGPGTDTAAYWNRTTGVRLSLNAGSDDGEQAEFDRLIAMENAIGGSGNDTLVGSNGDNFLSGGPGNDTIRDLSGADTVDGGAGNDEVSQDATKDVGDYIDGSSGVDTISYAARPATATGGVVIDIDSTNGTSGEPDEADSLLRFENAVGGAAPDTIIGTDGPNVITARDGANVVYGLDGADTITTGNGIDLVDDGPGSDRVSTGGECDRVLQIDVSTDDIQAGSGTCDVIDYSARTTSVTVNIRIPNPINGAGGEGDALRGFENATGGSGDDAIAGTGGPNLLIGGGGADSVAGMDGNDTIDVRDGVGGNDTADGGSGRDIGLIDAGDKATSIEQLTVF